jgi:acyl-coenzyme A synthetase/AMP-(fatty) acid ligase/3-hydroxymyristoyl/3-hydroxydecanoyl-(acyl carrier protein) dehydratase
VSPLCHLLQQDRDPSSEVARRWDHVSGAEQLVCWDAFRRDVAGLRDRIASGPDGAWVLLTEDAYAFAVGLFALWHAGRNAISPPNRQPSSLRVIHTRAAGVLSDRGDWFPESSVLHPVEGIEAGDPDSLTPLSPDALAMELFTSGTTGGEKPVTKRIRHLEDEVRELHATWNTLVGEATFFSAASHQHVYGLLFGVLWPLYAGRTFERHHYLHPGELVPRMREVGDCVLASVPTHLRRFVRHAHASTLRAVCRVVFSSGGPLAPGLAHDIAGALGAPPIEVLGSTETGGIAWRTQQLGVEECGWMPFNAVRVSCDDDDNLLRVRSPFVSVDSGEEGFATGDRISIRSDGRFDLEGRSDHIAKIGEKRLDLTRMASELRARPSVEEAALVTIDREAELRVAATIIPSEEGWELIQQEGERAFVQILRACLGVAWDPVLHPRYWRVVSKLPENSQGKVTLDALRSLFRSPESANAEADRPITLDQFRGRDHLERSCQVPGDLGCFSGHFPGQPVVPGALQFDWVMDVAAELLDTPPHVVELESLKFPAPLGPAHVFRIHVRKVADNRIEFTISGEDMDYAKGRVRLADGSKSGLQS